MNSFRAVKDAIVHEVARQIELIEAGGKVVQETRLWNETKAATFSMRSKEEAHDYRYFPEPDLVPIDLSDDVIEGFRKSLPELPEIRKGRFISQWGLTDYDAGVLISQKELADYFEQGLGVLPEKTRALCAKPLVNWITTELLGRLNSENKTIKQSPVSSIALAELVELIQAGTINGKMGKEIFSDIYKSGESPRMVVDKKGLSQVSNEAELIKFIDEVLAENPKIADDVRGGKGQAIGSLMGALMKKTKGRANPQLANDLLKKKILG